MRQPFANDLKLESRACELINSSKDASHSLFPSFTMQLIVRIELVHHSLSNLPLGACDFELKFRQF